MAQLEQKPLSFRMGVIGTMLLDYANGHPCYDPDLARKIGASLVNEAALRARHENDPNRWERRESAMGSNKKGGAR